MNKVKCPFNDCNTIFSFNMKNVTGKEYEKVCPKCSRSVKIYHLVSTNTQYEIDAIEKELEKKIEQLENSYGYILVEQIDGSVEKFELTKKKSEIGRKDPSSTSDIQIPTQDLTMSRMHFFLEYVHSAIPFFKLSKSKDLNGTYVKVNNILNENKELELRQMEPGEIARLEDEEVIIAGKTRIIVKVDKRNSNEDFRRINKNGIPPTIIT